MDGGHFRLGLAAIIALGAILRLIEIGAQPLWTDEALTAVIAQAPFWALATLPLDATGPVYYWLHQLFAPADAGPAINRLPSAIAGILLIPVTYASGSRLLGRPAALFAAALVALSFPLIDYSQEARAYSWLTLTLSTAGWALLSAAGEHEQKKRRWWLLAFCLASLVALYTHLVAFFLIGSWLVAARWLAGRDRVNISRWEILCCLALIAICALPEFIRILRYTREADFGFDWLRNLTPGELVRLIAIEWLPFLQNAGVLTCTMALLFLLAVHFVGRKQFGLLWGRQPLGLAVLVAWLLQPLLLWVVSLIFDPVLMYRTMLPSWPAFALTLAAALGGLRGRSWLAVTTATLAAYGLSLTITGLSRSKEDWGQVTEALARSGADAVLVCASWKAPALLATTGTKKPVAILIRQEGRWLLVGGNGTEPWPSSFARSAWFLEKDDWLGPPPPGEVRTLWPKRLAVVESECVGTEARQAILSLGGVLVSARPFAQVGDGDAAFGEAAKIDVRILELVTPVGLQARQPRD